MRRSRGLNRDIHRFQIGVVGERCCEIDAARVVAEGGVTEVVIFRHRLTIVGRYCDEKVPGTSGTVRERECKRLVAGRSGCECRVTVQITRGDCGQTVVRVDPLHRDEVIESTADGLRANVLVVPANSHLIARLR